jgi:beta-ureidopropionase
MMWLCASISCEMQGLSRVRDGVLIAEADLNLIQQVRDSWTFQMTARYGEYGEFLRRYAAADFKPHIIRE